ncbi:MAG: 30S ribosome-binding factor RbfA [Acidobacteria bacterium]|nr:30S ribosome-binding factor RbfA [Acidobacteriota bacterium]
MGRRNVRLAEEIQHVVMELIPYGLKDPRVENVTVTRVEMTADLKLAKIYVEAGGNSAARAEALRALKNARGYLRRELAAQINIRQIPDLAFYLDLSWEHQRRVEGLLRQLRSDRDKE